MAKELKKKRVSKLPRVEKERVEFKKLIIANPNYFGTVPKVKINPVLLMKYNTKYEELKCIGFYPESDLLEAIIDVKLPYGYNGNLCSQGSFEYVRFFVDWDGDGDFADPDEDVGITSVNVHDIPDGDMVCLDKTKPLSYAVTLRIDSRKRWCTLPNLVKVRAILSWNAQPTAGDPNYPPVWGNVVDKWIQIKPTKLLLADVIKAVDLKKLQLETKMLDLETPISKTKMLTPVELKAIYKGKDIPEHRFNLAGISQIAQKVKIDPGLMVEYKLDPKLSKIIGSIDAILAEKPNTKYEELHCVGLNYDMDTLVATLTVKLPYGYSGNLCTKGSQEYVAFWAYLWDQIEQMCYWKYLGTSSVNVHDIATIPSEGLQYAVYLPVDFSNSKDRCTRPKIIKIRGILSWQTPPPINNPNYNPVWGNKIDVLIQLKPSTPIEPGEQIPYIWAVGEMAVESISGNPYTVLPSALGDGYANGISVNGGFTALESPFGGVIAISGTITNAPNNPPEADKLKYKVQYRKTGEANWHDITNTFRIWIRIDGVPSGFIDQVADADGYFKYQKDLIPPVITEVQDDMLAQWNTPVPEDDGLYELRVLLYKLGSPPVAGVPPDHIASDVVKIMVDNKPPNAMLSLDLGPCTKYTIGDTITGTFTATDTHISDYALVVEPGPPSAPNPPTISPTGETYPTLPAPGRINEPFTVTTTDATTPCGYVIHLHVWDRTIKNNSRPGNYNGATVGLCLLEKGILKK